MGVNQGTRQDIPDILNILDGAMLDVALPTIRTEVNNNNTFVYREKNVILGVIVSQSTPRSLNELRVGTADSNGKHIYAIAVRRNRRNQGIGTTLLNTVVSSTGYVTAEFDESAKLFYSSLGFQFKQIGKNRYLGYIESKLVP